MRNRGAVLLTRTAQAQEAIGQAIGVSRVAVSHWQNGTTKPAPAARKKMRKEYGIPEDAWDEDANAELAGLYGKHCAEVRAQPSEPELVEDEIPEGVLGKARFIESVLYGMLLKARRDDGMVPLERAKVMASCTATLAHLAKITGQYELGSRLFKLPVWKRIEQAHEKALAKHPEAAAALATELRALDSENTYK